MTSLNGKLALVTGGAGGIGGGICEVLAEHGHLVDRREACERSRLVAGAGVSLMLNADLAIAAEGARFNLAHIDIAASCDGGAFFALPRITGLRNALEIALLGESFDAAQALRLSTGVGQRGLARSR